MGSGHNVPGRVRGVNANHEGCAWFRQWHGLLPEHHCLQGARSLREADSLTSYYCLSFCTLIAPASEFSIIGYDLEALRFIALYMLDFTSTTQTCLAKGW